MSFVSQVSRALDPDYALLLAHTHDIENLATIAVTGSFSPTGTFKSVPSHFCEAVEHHNLPWVAGRHEAALFHVIVEAFL